MKSTSYNIAHDAIKHYGELKEPEQLRNICTHIDNVFERLNGKLLHACVDSSEKLIYISFVCNEIIIENGSDELYAILSKASAFNVRKPVNKGDLNVEFAFLI